METFKFGILRSQRRQGCMSRTFWLWFKGLDTIAKIMNSYLVSWLIFRVTGTCSITALRSLNVGTLMIAPYLTYKILLSLSPEPGSKAKTRWSALSAANVWLFPPLFFFSGLYYTDVQSALWVLLSFQAYLRYEKDGFQSFSEAISLIRFGIIALFFRQTNVFWVAVFPAGLGVVSVLKQSAQKATYIHSVGFWEICQASWTKSALYDPSVGDAWIEDYMKSVVSIAIVALGNIPKLVRPLVPCVFLLAVFAGFVFWNGGVVLGMRFSLYLSRVLLTRFQATSPIMLQRYIYRKCCIYGHIYYSSRSQSWCRRRLLRQ
jgi:alpha-1,2-glucosyltransferase